MSREVSEPQLVPHSREAEEAVIGAVMINPDALYVDVSFLVPEHFYIYRNKWIWEAYIRLHSEGIAIDYLTVTEELDKMGHLADIGGSAYLTKIVNNCPSSLHAEGYGRRVEETYIRRQMLGGANETARRALDETLDVNEGIAESINDFEELVTVEAEGRSLLRAALHWQDTILIRADKIAKGGLPQIGFKTGIGYIDRNFLGLKKGWLVMFAGKPKVGKTRLVQQIAKTLAVQAPGSYINLEMDEETAVYRTLSMVLGISATDVELGKIPNSKALTDAVAGLSDDLEIISMIRPSIEEIMAYVAKQKAERGIEWIVIDYVDLMKGGNKRTETEEDKELWNDLKTKIAKKMNILVIALESVNKLAAEGIMTDDRVVGSYGKIHAVDVAFGYSPYHAIPEKGLPDISDPKDPDRALRCRVLNSMADRHRETTGIVMGLEMVNGLVDDMVKKQKRDVKAHWMDEK